MRVLLIDNVAAFWSRMDRNYRFKYEALQAHPAFRCVDVRDAAAAAAAEQFDVLLAGVFGTPLHPSFPDDVDYPPPAVARIPRKCLLVEDLHDATFVGGFVRLRQRLGADYQYLISTYDCPALKAVVRGCTGLRQTYIVPHHVNTDVFRDAGQERTWNVLLYGNVDRPWYGFRRRLFELIPRRIPRVHVIPHPTYQQHDPRCCGAGLAELLSRSLISVATPSAEEYLVAKYFEISACGAVVAGAMPPQAVPIWEKNYVRLDESMADDEIMATLFEALSDHERLAEKSRRMHARMHRDWSLANYVTRMLDVMSDICADRTVVPRP